MQITIPDNAELWLKQQAQQSGFESVQEYVLALVLPPQPTGTRSFYEAASAVGLIGGGSDYACDLSTNAEHMADFGK